METKDPIAVLGSRSIADRAAAARDLSQMGALAHLELLAEVAGTDRSPGVRLTAAAAAADILSRHRVGAKAAKLSAAARDECAAWFRRIDPDHNPGIFSVFACLDRPAGLAAIVGGLRDPRGDVRLGAGVGLMRLCVSLATADNSDLQTRVTDLLADNRHKPDALAEIARVCVAAGFQAVGPALERLYLPGTHGEVVATAQETLARLNDIPVGIWFSDGRDAGETNPNSPIGAGLVVFDGEGAVLNTGGVWKARKTYPASGARRMCFRRVGAAGPAPAFQADNRTWYGDVGPDLYAAIDGFVGTIEWDAVAETKATDLHKRLGTAAEGVLDETSDGQRALGQLRAEIGDLPGAVAALEAAVGLKKVPTDTPYLLAEALWASGRKKAAKGHYARFVKKATKRDFPEQMARAKSRM